jgi:hypothetical protein
LKRALNFLGLPATALAALDLQRPVAQGALRGGARWGGVTFTGSIWSEVHGNL